MEDSLADKRSGGARMREMRMKREMTAGTKSARRKTARLN